MVVTCESCQSKYKLDDSKITGRGAKITCPKCKHVFVVYTQQEAPAAPPAPAPPPPVAQAAPPPPPVAQAAPPPPEPPEDEDWEDDQPTRVAIVSTPVRASVREARHIGAAAQPAAPAGGARNNPTLAIPETDDHNVAYLPPPSRSTVTPAEAASRAAGLDFKRVGIAAWKVKVKIGIVYDFSDIKTLRKYIQDGRVTPSDVISHDGKSWRPIGEIGDLDVYFVDTYERLERERAAAAATPPPVPAPLSSGVLATPSGAPGSAPEPPLNTEERAKQAEAPAFRDAFDEVKAKQRERAAQRRAGTTLPPPGVGGGGSRLALVVTVVSVLVAGGAAWWWYSREAPTVAPTTTTTTTRQTAPPAPDVKAKLEETLAGSLTKKEPTTTAPTTTAPTTTPPPPVPDTTNTTVLPAGIPEGAVPVIPSDARRSTSGSSTGTSTQRTSETVRTGEATAADHEVMGDASARAGDWGGAVRGYGNAVTLDPNSARLLRKLGEAQYQAGDLDTAATNLKKAASAGQRDAYKTLGAIARKQGDTAGASAYYQQYLATNPRDAAEIQRILTELSAG